MCHGVCASDVTGLACGASDVTGLACVMASVRQMSRNVKTASPSADDPAVNLVFNQPK